MAKNVIIVNSDTGFATILQEALDNHPAFNALAVPTGAKALPLIKDKPFHLVIVDMAITGMSAQDLVATIRKVKPDIAIMVTPFIGQPVPPEIENLGIQGVLTKPFFVGDVPKLVGQAVGLNLEAEVPEMPTPPPEEKPKPRPRREAPPARETATRPRRDSRRPPARSGLRSSRRRQTTPPALEVEALPSWKLEQLHKNRDKIIDQLKVLNAEIRAEVVLLTAGAELIAKSGTMDDERAQHLAGLVAQSAESASLAAAFLGERDARFEQSLHEGNDFRLYAYSLGQGVVLSLALGTNLPLGILRHQTKRTGQSLIKYIK